MGDVAPIIEVLRRLPDNRKEGDKKFQWNARCPAHDDNRPSLSIGSEDGWGVGLFCQAGCTFDEIIAGLGLSKADVCRPNPSRNGNGKGKGKIIATYDYTDADGKLVFQVARYEPKDFRQRRPDGNGGWIWSVKGCAILPYRLPELLAADPSQTVFVCEGEEDCKALAAHNLIATCNAGGAGKWKKQHVEYLIGRPVVVLCDNDPTGIQHAHDVAKSLQGKVSSVKVVLLPDLPPKGDVRDWLNSGRTIGELHAIVNACSEWTPADAEAVENDPDDARREPIDRLTFADLYAANDTMRPSVLDGLLRKGETCNIISVSKVGKSWLSYNLALSIITCRPWLGRFDTFPGGKVLIIDNELHPETLAHRIRVVADAMGIEPEQFDLDLEVMSLRGQLRSLEDVAIDLTAIEPNEFRAFIWDAKYRFLQEGQSENDNADEARFYNVIDQIAAQTGAAQFLIHHSSKGSQSDKRVTDVGAGAGAQARAADTHLILREHENDGVVVLDAAVRSFPPVEPLALRWEFPLWLPADVDPSRLKGKLTAGEQRQQEKDKRATDEILKALLAGPLTNKRIQGITGMGRERIDRILCQLEYQGHITSSEVKIRGNTCNEYRLAE